MKEHVDIEERIFAKSKLSEKDVEDISRKIKKETAQEFNKDS